MSPHERNHPNRRIPPGQLTERFAPFTPEQAPCVRQTVVIEPVRLAPVQKTVVIEPVRPVQRTATIQPSLGEPALDQDTVTLKPFWLSELEPAPAMPAERTPINRVETAFASPIEVAPQISPAQAAHVPTDRNEIAPAAEYQSALSQPRTKPESDFSSPRPEAAWASTRHNSHPDVLVGERCPSSTSPINDRPDRPETLETVCFEPIHVPEELLRAKLAASNPPPAKPRPSNALFMPSAATPKGVSPKALLLEGIGQLSKQRPFIVWAGGAALAFAVSAAVSFGFAHRKHAEPRHPAATSRSTSVAAAKVHAPIPLALSKIAADNVNQAAPVAALEINPAAPAATPGTPPKKGKAFDPALSAAVGHLLAGRYGDAKKTYAELVSRTAPDPTLVVVSKLLAAKLGSNCVASNPAVSCPEVKQ